MEGLEPTCHPGQTKHRVCRHRCRQATHLDSTEIAHLEQRAQQLARSGTDYHAIRRGDGLQPCREVRRLSNYAALLGLTFAREVADDDHAGLDADAQRWSLKAGQKRGVLNNRETGPQRALDVALVRVRIAEIHQHAVAHVSRHETVETGDKSGDATMIGGHHIVEHLGIDRVVEEGLLVLRQRQAAQPGCNIHRSALLPSSHLAQSVSLIREPKWPPPAESAIAWRAKSSPS